MLPILALASLAQVGTGNEALGRFWSFPWPGSAGGAIGRGMWAGLEMRLAVADTYARTGLQADTHTDI